MTDRKQKLNELNKQGKAHVYAIGVIESKATAYHVDAEERIKNILNVLEELDEVRDI